MAQVFCQQGLDLSVNKVKGHRHLMEMMTNNLLGFETSQSDSFNLHPDHLGAFAMLLLMKMGKRNSSKILDV